MSDLISRQEAIAHLKHRLYETQFNNDTEHPYYEEIADDRIDVWMNEVPSVQPEQKHGKWILKDKSALDREPKTGEEMFCDQCGEMALGYPFWECDLKPSNFCPNCGARMDGDYTDD